MKKHTYILLTVVLLSLLGSFMTPAYAQSVSDPEGDVIGVDQWTEGGNPRINCDWVWENSSMIDIATIAWLEVGTNYTVTMSFYGQPNATLIENSTIVAGILFLINGSVFPEELEDDSPEAHFTISTEANGTVMGNSTSVQINTMVVSGNDLSWTFNKSLAPVTPVVLDNWDVVAFSLFQQAEGNHTYAALDHYNFDYMEDLLKLACSLINLQIPGYSLIVVGVIAVITVGILIKKKYDK
ncbi:MAG: hypothetical protein JW776_00510 [Candidatus Lokiarchaeota archaeon]|nr:hypothetical protein [Candidatus Lokiarchaeota archaeon]